MSERANYLLFVYAGKLVRRVLVIDIEWKNKSTFIYQ